MITVFFSDFLLSILCVKKENVCVEEESTVVVEREIEGLRSELVQVDSKTYEVFFYTCDPIPVKTAFHCSSLAYHQQVAYAVL